MKQCTQLEEEWQRIRDAVSKQHQSCLDGVAASKRNCADDPVTGCSCEGCAQYHNSGKLGQDEVNECRQNVQAYQESERKRKEELDRQQRERERQEAEYKERLRKEDEDRKAREQKRRDDDRAREQQRADRDRERERERSRREEQAKRDREALDRAAEASRRAQAALRERTQQREEEQERISGRQDAARDRFEADTQRIQDRAASLTARLENGIAGSFFDVDTAGRISPTDLADFDVSALEGGIGSSLEFADVVEKIGAIDDGLSRARTAFRDWVQGSISESRDALIEQIVDDRSISDLAMHIIDGSADTRSGIRQMAERAFNSLTDAPAQVVTDDISSWINERLSSTSRTGPWITQVREALVEQGVSYVVSSAAEAVRENIASRMEQAWDTVTGRGPAPPENTLQRAEWELWKHAEPSNIILSTSPGQGVRSIRGIYDWGVGLVDRFSTFMGFAVGEISR